MSKQFMAVILAVILVFVAIFVFGNKSTNSPTSGNGALSQHIEGLGQDHVTLVEYGDYECPYCGSYFPIVNQIAAQYNNQITFQFRNFPLTSIHPNAFAGARAAEAAALQGKFWQMHDLLYQQNEIYYANNQPQNNWVGAPNPQTYFDQLATQLGLNLTKFNQDYTSNLVNGTINADMAEGNKLGVSGTPAFFLDGKQISVGESAAQFQSIINTEIAKKTGKATTTSPTSAGSTAQTHK